MRDRVLQALDIYADGGTIFDAVRAVRLCPRDFYKAKRENQDIATLYETLKRDRGDMASEEHYRIAEELSTGLRTDAHIARVEAEIRQKTAALYDPTRYGQRVNLQADAGPNILGAMAEAQRRLPPRNPITIIDAKPLELIEHATDTQLDASGDQADSSSSAASDDPFED